MIDKYKAVLIFGGPGSGKDMLLRSTFIADNTLVEVDLSKLHKAIIDNQDVLEVNEGKPLIVNGNADGQKISLVRSVLEAVGYDVMGLYVYTTDEVSRERNEARIKAHAKTITEEVRRGKWVNAVETARTLQKEFKKFEVFNNSSNVMTEEVQGWIDELNEILFQHFEPRTEIDLALEEFLAENNDEWHHGTAEEVQDLDEEREPRSEYGANQVLSATARMPKKPTGGMNDYFHHNAQKTNVTNRNIRDPKVSKPASSMKTGPGDSTSTAPRGMNEDLPSFTSMRPNRLSRGKQAKRPTTTDTVRPQDSVGGAFGSQGQNGTPSVAGSLVGEGKVSKFYRKQAKPPVQTTDARAGDDMAGVETLGEAKIKKALKNKFAVPAQRGDARVTPVNGETQMFAMNATEQVYEDWGVEGKTAMFEGRVIKINKPFKVGKTEYGVYIKDGDTVSMLKFTRKNAITINENVGPTDVRFWETK